MEPSERCTGYQVGIYRDRLNPEHAVVSVSKWFWSVSAGSRSQVVAAVDVVLTGLPEGEAIALCLETAAGAARAARAAG